VLNCSTLLLKAWIRRKEEKKRRKGNKKHRERYVTKRE